MGRRFGRADIVNPREKHSDPAKLIVGQLVGRPAADFRKSAYQIPP